MTPRQTITCRQAERLLWEYVEALGESNRAHAEYIEAIRTGPRRSIKAMERVIKRRAEIARAAREAFRAHTRDHGCQG